MKSVLKRMTKHQASLSLLRGRRMTNDQNGLTLQRFNDLTWQSRLPKVRETPN